MQNKDNNIVNMFHYKHIQNWDLTMHVKRIGFGGCDLIKKLEELSTANPVNRVTIRGNIYDSIKMRIIMAVLEDTQVKSLHLGNNSMDSSCAKCIADGLRYTNITTLSLYNNNIGSMGVKYLADNLKNTCITYLGISANDIGDDGAKYLAEGLKNTNVISLDVGQNGIKIDGIKCLADALQDTNLTCIYLSNKFLQENNNEITDEGVEYLLKNLKNSNITRLTLDYNDIGYWGATYLAEHLKDTCITSLSIQSNKIENNGIQYLVQALKDTQIIKIRYDFNLDDFYTKRTMTDATSQNRSKATKIKETFAKLVAQNTETHDIEFIIPDELKDLDMAEYLYIMKILNDEPNVKGHIFDMIVANNCEHYPNIIKKINEFIPIMPKKFTTFIENNLPKLVELFAGYDFVNLVKQFENAKFQEVVQNLLLHRVLYYVDENAEILHPYIYKMLDKYKMPLPLYNEQLEPDKKEKIISFYENHGEIDGAQDIIDLLGSESSQV